LFLRDENAWTGSESALASREVPQGSLDGIEAHIQSIETAASEHAPSRLRVDRGSADGVWVGLRFYLGRTRWSAEVVEVIEVEEHDAVGVTQSSAPSIGTTLLSIRQRE
jgi:hypothetical protein